MTEDQQQQLSALLRLKRFEQPPPGYFEKLLQDVQRRQRADLLRRPAWKLALERIQTFLGQHSMGYGAYAGAMAAIMALAVAAVTVSGPRKAIPSTSGALVAKQAPVDLRSDRQAETILSLSSSPTLVAGSPQVDASVANARLFPSRIARGSVSSGQPRYVIDTQPVSYEATTVSFNF